MDCAGGKAKSVTLMRVHRVMSQWLTHELWLTDSPLHWEYKTTPYTTAAQMPRPWLPTLILNPKAREEM